MMRCLSYLEIKRPISPPTSPPPPQPMVQMLGPCRQPCRQAGKAGPPAILGTDWGLPCAVAWRSPLELRQESEPGLREDQGPGQRACEWKRAQAGYSGALGVQAGGSLKPAPSFPSSWGLETGPYRPNSPGGTLTPPPGAPHSQAGRCPPLPHFGFRAAAAPAEREPRTRSPKQVVPPPPPAMAPRGSRRRGVGVAGSSGSPELFV